MLASWQSFAWADDYHDEIIEWWTVAVIEGRPAAEVLRIYGGDPGAPVGDLTFAQLLALVLGPEDLDFHLQLIEVGGLVVVVEGGYAGRIAEIARRCTADGGRFLSIGFASNCFPDFTQAIDGRITASFEMYPGDKPYQVGALAPPWIKALTVDIAHVDSTALAVLEEQTGLAFDRKWLDQARPTYSVPDPDWMLRELADPRRL